MVPEIGARNGNSALGLFDVAAQHLHVLGGSLQVDLGLGVGILRSFQIGQRDGAFVVQQLRARQLLAQPTLHRL